MNTIGINIDETRIDGDLERLSKDLDAICDMGIRAVELPVHGLDAIMNAELNERKLHRLVPLLAGYDLSYSIHAPNPVNLMDPVEPMLHLEVLRASLEFARRIHATVVVLHGGRFIPEEAFHIMPARSLVHSEKEKMLEQEASLLQDLADLFPDVMIAVENARPYLGQSPYAYGERPEALLEQIQRIDRKNVRINLDVGHLHMASRFYGFDALKAVEIIRPGIVHTHIHDNFGGAVHHWEKKQTHQLPFGKGDGHMPVGFGTVPIREILEILLPSYQGRLMMELRGRYFSDITTSRDTLLNLVSKCPGIEKGHQHYA